MGETIFSGAEDIDVKSGSVSVGSLCDSNARCSLSGDCRLMPFSPITTAYFSFSVGKPFNYYAGSGLQCGLCCVPTSKAGIWIANSSGYIQLQAHDGTAAFALATGPDTSLFNSIPAADIRFDLVVTDFGAASNIKVYANKSLIIDWTGDSSIAGYSALTCVGIVGTKDRSEISKIIVADEDTQPMEITTVAINAAGDTNEFDYGLFSDVNEVTLSDATQIYATTADKLFLANATGMPAGDWIVKSFRLAARCVDGLGNVGIKLGVKSGGTVDVGAAENCSGYWQTKERMMQVNPVTSNPFTPSEIVSLQLAVKSGAV